MSPWHSVSQGPSTTLLCWCREDILQGARHTGSAAVIRLMSSTVGSEQHRGQQVMCSTSLSPAPRCSPVSLPNAHKCLIKLNNSARRPQITSQGFLCILHHEKHFTLAITWLWQYSIINLDKLKYFHKESQSERWKLQFHSTCRKKENYLHFAQHQREIPVVDYRTPIAQLWVRLQFSTEHSTSEKQELTDRYTPTHLSL